MSDIPPALPPSGSSPAPSPTSQPATPRTGTAQTPAAQTPTGQGQAAQGSVPQAAPAPGSSTAPPAPQVASSSAQAPALPPDLARAAAGTTVQGEVRSVGPDGGVTVRTAQGDVRLDLSRAQVAQLLRPGTPVTIEIRNPTVQPVLVQLSIRAAPGAAVSQGAAGSGTPSPGGATSPAGQLAVTTGSAAPAPTVPLTVGRIVQATVVPGPTGGGPTGGGPTGGQAAPAPAAAATPQPALPGAPAGAQANPAQPATGQPATSPAAASPAAAGSGPTVATPAAATSAATAPAATTPAATTPAATTPAATTPATTPANTGAAATAPARAAAPAGAAVAGNPAAGASAATGQAGSAPPGRGVPAPTVVTPGAQASTAAASRGNAPQGNAPQGNASTAAAAASTGGGQAAPAAGRAALPNGAVLTVRIAAVAEAAARPDGAARAVTGLVNQDTSAGAPARIAGQIAGLTAAGRPVVQSPVGFLALDARADLRLGTAIALDVLASRTARATERSAPLPVLAREWPALEATLRVLEEQLGPAAARQSIEAMPRPGQQLTATMLFFMVALRAGDVRGWLGRTAAQALESAGRGELLKSLSDDFQTLQRAAEPSEAGWRSFLIPVAWDERRPIRFLTRKERREGRDGRSGKPGTAFLVDLDLTNIGPFRLDGLVRNELLDLLIRTTTPLPPVMRRDIKALFDGTLERTGIIGRLAFKASPVMPPLPVDLDASSPGGTTTLTV